jgi:hypothetical protein
MVVRVGAVVLEGGDRSVWGPPLSVMMMVIGQPGRVVS